MLVPWNLRPALLLVLVAGGLGSVGPTAYACTLDPGFLPAQPPEPSLDTPKHSLNRPTVELVSIDRGTDAQTACAAWGTLTLRIDGYDPEHQWGLRVKLVEGAFPESELPAEPVTPLSGPDGFFVRLRWLDLPNGRRYTSPVKARIAIELLANTGQVSKPGYVNINHPGGGLP
ncbi:MAG: hypothetical protein AAF648_04810 [Pseudomonadota bacterium]